MPSTTIKHTKHLAELSSRHPKLKKLIAVMGPVNRKIPAWDSLNDAVFHAIVSQMLSTKAARSISRGLLDEFGTSEGVIRWAMRHASVPGPAKGLSQNKKKALAEWGKFINKNKDVAVTWKDLPFKEYKKEVVKIWGLGSWSADMIAIFYFGKMDVWPAGDLGIKKASEMIFGTVEYDKISKYIGGHETLVCLYFWEMLNQKITL